VEKRNPEIVVPRPTNIAAFIKAFFCLGVYPKYFRNILLRTGLFNRLRRVVLRGTPEVSADDVET
jgi:hypothetical protein